MQLCLAVLKRMSFFQPFVKPLNDTHYVLIMASVVLKIQISTISHSLYIVPMSKHALFELFATRRSLNPYLVKLHSPPEIGTDVDDLILILSMLVHRILQNNFIQTLNTAQ